MSSGISIDLDNLNDATSKIPRDKPIIMLNLLRFKAQASYPDDQESSLSGRDTYMQRYIPAFNATVQKELGSDAGVSPLFLGKAHANLVKTDGFEANEPWDIVALITYPSLETFRKVVESPYYLANAQAHRLASLDSWQLLLTTALEA